jgi:hypothetical protein
MEEAMERRRSLLKSAALFSGMMLGLGLAPFGGAAPANAQTYVCPPGYYFLANYGCYPFGGYSYYAPPPGYYYAPNPYYAYPQYGVTLQFGGRGFDHDHDHDGHDGGRGGFEHRH